MLTSAGNDFRISRLMLGTVQFGMPYGVANRTGQPCDSDVVAIVESALAGGINCFDTAAVYGSSEEVLGRALRRLAVTDQVVVATKVRPLTPRERVDTGLASQAIERCVDQSRSRLQLDCLPIVLFHREVDAVHMEVLATLKDKGWLRCAGVSCGHQQRSAARIVSNDLVSAVQLPASVLDRRHADSGLFKATADRGTMVLVRSIFLQGLLVMPESDIPQVLSEVIPLRRSLESIAASAGMNLTELAMRYMLSEAGVTSVVVGVETVEQIRNNVAMAARGPLPDDLLAAVHATACVVPEMVITPYHWPQHALNATAPVKRGDPL